MPGVGSKITYGLGRDGWRGFAKDHDFGLALIKIKIEKFARIHALMGISPQGSMQSRNRMVEQKEDGVE